MALSTKFALMLPTVALFSVL